MHTNISNIDIHFEELVIELAKDTGVLNEDAEYVLRRFKSEGLRFLTFTLPSLSKAVLFSLENGVFERPTAFAWKSKSLYFMYSFLSKIFCPKTGKVLDDADPYSIRSLRQFCEYFYKLALSTSDEDKEKGELKYIENEQLVKQFEPSYDWCNKLRVNLVKNYPTFVNTPVCDVFNNHRPRFGPGSFGSTLNVKTDKTSYKKLPSSTIGLTTKGFKAFSGYFKSYPDSSEVCTLQDESKTSVVTFVAKDARGPRIISMEPMHLLKAQMSYLDWAIHALQGDTDGRIQFVDQSENQQQAKIASVDRRRATLDLKDASDRVSYKLVSRVFQNTLAPAFFLKNARSTHTKLPSGKIIPLHKVAGMGSGLTFPTMSLIIHLSICTLVSERFGLPYSQAMRAVNVYGDDVIIPTSWYNVAVTALTRSGLLVNTEKSFYKGHFRESCGGDYFKGINVTPLKLRLDKVGLMSARDYKRVLRLNSDRQVFKLNAHTRELYKVLLINTKGYLDKLLRSSLRFYPKVTGESPLIGEYTDLVTIRDSVSVRAYSLNPVVQENTDHCAYKYLGERFSSADRHTYCTFREMIQRISLPLGAYIRPRDIKLTLKVHPGTKTY